MKDIEKKFWDTILQEWDVPFITILARVVWIIVALSLVAGVLKLVGPSTEATDRSPAAKVVGE